MNDEKAFDIKLKDGRYLRNVIPCDEDGVLEDKAYILDCGYRNDEGELVNDKIYLYHISDYDGDFVLAEIMSEDIEYICEAYKDKKSINIK